MRRKFTVWALVAAVAFAPGLSGQVPSMAELDLTLGGIDAPDHLSFVRPPTILASAAGELFVLDRHAGTVSVFGPEGDLVRQFGAQGQGPGEFTSPQSLGMLGDTVWITDFPAPRVSFFNIDGEHLRTDLGESYDLGVPTSAPNGLTAFHSGGFATLVPNSFPVGLPGRVELPVLHGSRDGPLSPAGHVVMPPGLTVDGVGHFAFHPVPISPRVIEDHYGRGWVVVEWAEESPGELSVRRIDADGAMRWSTSVSVPTVAVDQEALVDAGLEMAGSVIEGAVRRGDVSGDARGMVERGLYLPERATSLGTLFIDAEDRVWLEISGVDEYPEWIVLNARGSVERRVRVPAGVQLRTAAGSTAWGVSSGEFDETYLVRVRF